MMRRGDDPKLAPAEEEALLLKLRLQREMKAHATLQSEVQSLSAKMLSMDLADVPAEAKRVVAVEKVLAYAPADAQVAIVLNAILRRAVPPPEEDTKKGGKGGKSKGGKSGGTSFKPTKIVEGVPPSGPEVRKALKAHTHLIAEATGGSAEGQRCLLKALQSWLLSPQGVTALPMTSKIIEVLYDGDRAEEESLTKYWAEVHSQLAREEAELTEAIATHAELQAEQATAQEAFKVAEREESDAAWYLKQAEVYARNVRCGGNPSKEDEATEKVALASLKKNMDYHIQTQKVLAARNKNLIEASSEFEPAQRVLDEARVRKEVGITLFAKHATQFFEWLATEDDEEEDDE